MTYRLTFLLRARKEWEELDWNLREQFRKKLEERKVFPRIEKDKLSGMKDCYKIKLRSVGYRLIYRVFDDRIVIQVVAIGKRDKSAVYETAIFRTETQEA
jgi:mRNA interferase RelE/StbE